LKKLFDENADENLSDLYTFSVEYFSV